MGASFHKWVIGINYNVFSIELKYPNVKLITQKNVSPRCQALRSDTLIKLLLFHIFLSASDGVTDKNQ